MRNFRRIAALAVAATALTPMLASPAWAQSARAEAPLYKDARQPVAARVEDLLGRMTLEEKVAQLIAIWEHKDRIQTPNGDFDPVKASQAFPNGLGMISRPSDRRGVTPAANGAAGAAAGQGNRSPAETATYINAAQKWAVEKNRLGIPMILHEEALHGLVAPGATSFPQSIALANPDWPVTEGRTITLGDLPVQTSGRTLAQLVHDYYLLDPADPAYPAALTTLLDRLGDSTPLLRAA